MERIRGLKALILDGVEVISDLVERTQRASAERQLRRLDALTPVGPLARQVAGVQQAGASLVFTAIRSVSRAVGVSADVALEALETLGAPGAPAGEADEAKVVVAAQGALAGAIGDHLHRQRSGLDIGMSLRHAGRLLRLDDAERLRETLAPTTGRIVVFIHGLATTERSWSFGAAQRWGDPRASFGSKLREEHGYTPLFVRYNTGRRVAENGCELARLLERLVDLFPGGVEELSLVGHSMGGLVARSAASHGAGLRWSRALRHVVCIGAPHRGAPLEQGASLLHALLGGVDTAAAQVLREVLGARSAGIKDLGFVDEQGRGREPDASGDGPRRQPPLLEHVGYHYLAASAFRDPDHPVGRLVGDLLVRVSSATDDGAPRIRARAARDRVVLGGLHHLDLLTHPEVYAQLKGCLRAPP